jgi:hypothetical protein
VGPIDASVQNLFHLSLSLSLQNVCFKTWCIVDNSVRQCIMFHTAHNLPAYKQGVYMHDSDRRLQKEHPV